MSKTALKITSRLTCYIIGFVVMYAGLWTTYSLVLNATEYEHERVGVRVLEKMATLAATFEDVRRQAEALPGEPCSQDKLAQYRHLTFIHPGVADVGVFAGDRIACTAIAGNIEVVDLAGQESATNELLDGDVWVSRTFEYALKKEESLAARLGNVLLVAEPTFFDADANLPIQWELVTIPSAASSSAHVAGRNGLFKQDQHQGTGHTDIHVYNELCLPEAHHCVALHTDGTSILQRNLRLIVLGCLLAILAAYIATKASFAMLKRRSSVTYRTMSALRNDLFTCHYQPIYDLDAGAIVGCEVLARLDDEFGSISPVEFIPIISAANETQRFSEALFNQAYSQLKNLPVGSEPFKLSFNIFPDNINIRTVTFFSEHPILSDPRFVINLEITEDAEIHNPTYDNLIASLSGLNVEISVDDFGTGYCNFYRLELAGVNYLKVDRSLISKLTPENAKDSLAAGIPILAAGTGLKVIAEGIETADTLSAVKALGFAYGQGYYFDRPKPFDDFSERYVAQQRSVPRLAV